MSRYSFIREERFFCSLLMYTILIKPSTAFDLFEIQLEDDFEIYNEPSILRDYWFKLGNPYRGNQSHIDQLNERRIDYLTNLCRILELDIEQLRNQDCFYSRNNEGISKYVNSPSNYINDEISYKPSIKLRNYFNMRQDLLIINGDTLNFFEAKMEAANDSKQIHRFISLRDLLDCKGNGWAGIDEFEGIQKVNLFYIQKSERTPHITDSDLDILVVKSWKPIFSVMRKDLKDYSGLDIESVSSYMGFD